MGAQDWALALLGVGILSRWTGAGIGLGQLGTGVQTLVAAPLTGTGTGLTAFAQGLRDLAMSFGDIGRGIAAIFAAVPKTGPQGGLGGTLPTAPAPVVPSLPPMWAATLPLITSSGGDTGSNTAGGGGSVPKPVLPQTPIGAPGPSPIKQAVLYTGGSTTMAYLR